MRRAATRSATPFPGIAIIAGASVALVISGCRRSPTPAPTIAPPEQRTVLTSFYPLTYFTRRIAGNRVQVECPCPTTVDPSFWIPTRSDLSRFQAASLVLLNGAGYEHWTAGAALSASRTIETAQPFADEFLQLPTLTHSHGAAGPHTHSGVDGHTWMDPVHARQQAEEILSALSKRWPADASVFAKGFEELTVDLRRLDSRYRDLTPRLSNVVIYASHPAYGYVAQRYLWQIKNVVLPPDEMPSPDTWHQLLTEIAPGSTTQKLILFEEKPLDALRDRLSHELKLTSVVFRPCENAPVGEDYLSVMLHNIDELQRALRPSPQ